MSIEVSPFLISRNATFDYRVIVAPQYMVDNKVTSLLAKATSGDFTLPMSAIYREVHHYNPNIGVLSLIFCILQANTHHIGLEGNDALKDGCGRPIRLIEGFVVRGQQPDIVVTQRDLERVHMLISKDYRSFWDETTGTPTVKSSGTLDIAEKSDEEDVLTLHLVIPYIVKAPLFLDRTEQALIDKADLLAAEKFCEKALETYDQVIQNNPDSAPAYRGKGDAFYYLHRYLEAERAYDRAIELNSNYALAHNGKGLIFSYRHEREKAINAYKRAIEYDPDCALAYANMGNDLSELHRHDEALRAYEQALTAYDRLIETQDNKAIWHYYKSLTLKDLKKRKEADLEMKRAQGAGFKRK
jgi:tetratricopeptide (TPR) repeat protein